LQKIVQIGPYKSVDRIIPQNRQTVLTRLLKSVNGCLCRLSRDVICQAICLSTIALCQSGFSFRVCALGSRVFGSSFQLKEYDDFSKKPRLRTSSQYLLESLNGLYFALFNGAPELAVQAVDAVHQRALYEFYADVILVTNSICETLLESNFHKNEELLTAHWIRPGKLDNHKGNEVVTNASLRLKKMPEDISPVVDDDIKGFNFSDSVENFKKRITVKVEQRKLKRQFGHHRRRSENSNENAGDIELGSINEEPISCATPNSLIFDTTDETPYQISSLHHSISHGLAKSENNVSVSFRQDQIHNGASPKPRNESVDCSIPTDVGLSEVIKSTSVGGSIRDLANWHGNIQHIDSITDTLEGTLL
uniref:RB_A domain-containing protein n=1 Tax=Elaeophora elaphi TaxID=1147741 RepID=A0A0R3RN98_9BILA